MTCAPRLRYRDSGELSVSGQPVGESPPWPLLRLSRPPPSLPALTLMPAASPGLLGQAGAPDDGPARRLQRVHASLLPRRRIPRCQQLFQLHPNFPPATSPHPPWQSVKF